MVPTLKLALPIMKVAAVAAVAATAVTVGVRHYRHGPAAPSVSATRAVAAAPSSAASDDPLAGADAPGEDTLQRAQDAYVHGEYDEAIDLAKRASAGDAPKAWRIIGASSCFKQDSAGAIAAWRELDGRGKKFIEYVCKRNDVTLPDGAPVL